MESAAEDDEAQLQLVPIVMQQTHEEGMTFVGHIRSATAPILARWPQTMN